MLDKLLALGRQWIDPRPSSAGGDLETINSASLPAFPSSSPLGPEYADASRSQASCPATTPSTTLQQLVSRNVRLVRGKKIPPAYTTYPIVRPSRRFQQSRFMLGPRSFEMSQPEKYAELRQRKLDLLKRSRAYLAKHPEPVQSSVKPLSAERKHALEAVLRHPKKELLGEPFKIQIYVEELQRLCYGHWLNDSIIDAFLAHITDGSEVFAFTTHFYTKLEEEGPKAVRRWAIRKKLNVLAKPKILVPVNRGNMHWCLAVIDNQAKSFKYYDSLSGGGADVIENLSKYMIMEADRVNPNDTAGNHKLIEGYARDPMAPCPQQENGSDCGVFVCENAYFTAKTQDFAYTQADIPLVRENIAYTLLSLSKHLDEKSML